MGLEKRTIKIIAIVAAVVLVLGIILGVLLGLLLPQRYVELEVWPRSEEHTWNEPLIHLRSNDPGSWHHWYRRLNDFLREYETSVPEDPPRAPCSVHNRADQHVRTDTCEIAMRMWGPCTADNFYGYAVGKPCVFLRLAHLHYWVPEPYNMSTSLPVPEEMPHHIKQAMRFQRTNSYEHEDFIWVSCDGEFSADKENLGPIQYIPANLPPGFPTKRLHTANRIPYATRNLPDEVPGPLVAVHFENPRRGIVINVECRIWTRDIQYYPGSRVGRARFELYID